jgi:hypothetical protein
MLSGCLMIYDASQGEVYRQGNEKFNVSGYDPHSSVYTFHSDIEPIGLVCFTDPFLQTLFNVREAYLQFSFNVVDSGLIKSGPLNIPLDLFIGLDMNRDYFIGTIPHVCMRLINLNMFYRFIRTRSPKVSSTVADVLFW